MRLIRLAIHALAVTGTVLIDAFHWQKESRRTVPVDWVSDTSALEREKRLLDQQLAIDAKAVNDLIAENARKAQNQAEYRDREAALVSRYEETEAKRNAVAEQISQRVVRRRKLERFIETVTGLPELYTKFDKGQWSALVDSVTVMDKKRLVWTLTSGMEVES